MDFKPEDLYPIHEIPVPDMQHRVGKWLLASVVGLLAAAAADKAYDFGLGAFRHFKNR